MLLFNHTFKKKTRSIVAERAIALLADGRRVLVPQSTQAGDIVATLGHKFIRSGEFVLRPRSMEGREEHFRGLNSTILPALHHLTDYCEIFAAGMQTDYFVGDPKHCYLIGEAYFIIEDPPAEENQTEEYHVFVLH